MTAFAPTPEQAQAVEMFASGDSLAIEAGAGTGKTSTLLLLAAAAPQRTGQYIAFNKAIVEEAGEKFPGSVACNTAHSLAFRATGKRFQDRLRASSRMKSLDIANLLKIDGLAVTGPAGNRKLLSRSFLAGLAMRGITRFCQSADAEPTAAHVPYIDGIDALLGEGKRGYANNREVARALEPALRRAWADLTSRDGVLPFKHDVYLKLAHLEGLRIGADFILFDEAQDANPVLVAIVEAQTHAQLVWVGDSQQQIYAFTGAINALGNIASDHRTFLTQSFRFGPAIADQANTILSWIPSAELRLVGTDTIGSVVTFESDGAAKPSAVLTRTNATAVREVLEAQRAGGSPHLVGGSREIVSFAQAAEQLMNGERTSHPELACFENWGEVQDYVDEDEQGDELRLMVKLVDEFGVPTIGAALGAMAAEQRADLIVSTAHKSKGREWDSVRLAADFPDDRAKLTDDEKRLLYVACTRAKVSLDLSAVAVLAPDYDSDENETARAEKEERRAARAAAREPAEAIGVQVVAGPAVAEVPATLEEGRYEIEGEVVSTKVTYGRLCMLVQLDGTECRVYGTAPKVLGDVDRGIRVRFTADVERSKNDASFGFFNRPAQAETL